MATSARGTGCWTCKLRKKKCDDTHPVCGPCDFRNITCHGYGPKPQFLCSSEDQKREIAKIQRAVSDSFKARRAFRVSKVASRPTQIRTVIPASATRQDETADLTEAYKTQLSLEPPPIPVPTSVSSVQSATVLPLAEPWPGTSQDSSLLGTVLPAGLINLLEQEAGPVKQNEGEYPHIFLQNAYPAQNSQELTLIMNYMNKMFPLQYYFYQPIGNERGRDWLLALSLRSKPSYYITLAFSVLQQIRFVYDDSSSRDHRLYEELDRYHSLGINELQRQLDYLSTVSGPEHLAVGVEILACTLQLFGIDLFRQSKMYQGWKGDWEVHLNAAGSLLAIIGAELMKSSESSTAPITLDRNSSPENTGDSPPGPISLDEMAGLDFFTSTYIWADISRCASIGARTYDQDPFPYIAYLEEDRICLDRMMGVKNWAMLSIRQTSDLEAWKISFQDHLNIPMLYRKASEIEDRLDRGLEKGPQDVPSSKLACESQLVTEIYALSALLYLTIVVSGNSHLTPKVRLVVPKALERVKNLPAHLLIRISWPFCVAGCMAAGNEKKDFEDIVSDAAANGHKLGTLLNSLELVKEFWVLREDSEELLRYKCRSNTPWALAMERLETKTIIL